MDVFLCVQDNATHAGEVASMAAESSCRRLLCEYYYVGGIRAVQRVKVSVTKQGQEPWPDSQFRAASLSSQTVSDEPHAFRISLISLENYNCRRKDEQGPLVVPDAQSGSMSLVWAHLHCWHPCEIHGWMAFFWKCN